MGWDDLNTFEGKQQVNSVKQRSKCFVCVCSCQTMRAPGYEIETDCSVLSQRTKLRLKFEPREGKFELYNFIYIHSKDT